VFDRQESLYLNLKADIMIPTLSSEYYHANCCGMIVVLLVKMPN
jgi:hypothetical protein